MHNFLKVEGSSNLVRDPKSGAILNLDKDEYSRYLERTKQIEEEKQRMLNQEEEINNLKCEVTQLKQLVKLLIEKQ